MIVRSLDVLDLPLLSRYRRDMLSLDSARILTRGNPLGAAALLSYLDPRRHIYTAVASENGSSLMGQVTLREEETSARLTFLAPAENLNGLTLPLLEHLVTQAGSGVRSTCWPKWTKTHRPSGCCGRPALPCMPGSASGNYPPRIKPGKRISGGRRLMTDWPAVQSLYGQIVPALLHPVEVLPKQVMGLVCSEGNLQAYVAVNSGPKGIWIQPIVPPDSDCVSEQLAGLAHAVADWHAKPIYVCVRSYQAWLESVLEDLGAQAGPRQAVMVRRLAQAPEGRGKGFRHG